MVRKKRILNIVMFGITVREFFRAIYYQLMASVEPHQNHFASRNQSIKRILLLGLGWRLVKGLSDD